MADLTWSEWRDLNSHSFAYQANVLPIKLHSVVSPRIPFINRHLEFHQSGLGGRVWILNPIQSFGALYSTLSGLSLNLYIYYTTLYKKCQY